MSDDNVTDFMKPPADGEDQEVPAWQQVIIDTSRPSIARSYDYMLDGKDNFAVDREATEALVAAVPDSPRLARENRDWLGRVTRYLADEAGIRQIIDLGSGLPTSSNIHDFARQAADGVRVAYVDIDPMVLAHGRAILATDATTTVITADVRDTEAVFTHPELTDLLDLDQPFAVILASVLHHLPAGEDQRVAAAIRARLRPGCYLAVANFHNPGDERAATIQDHLLSAVGSGWFRPFPQHRMYFGDLELVSPGLGPVNEWRPDDDTPADSPVHHLYIGGLARRP